MVITLLMSLCVPVQTNISVQTHVPFDSFSEYLNRVLISLSVLILVRLNIDGKGNTNKGYAEQAYTALN